MAKVEYRHANAHRSLLHRRIVALMQLAGFLRPRERFIRAGWVLVGVAVVVALRLIVFASAANPPQDEPADTPTEASGDPPPGALVGN